MFVQRCQQLVSNHASRMLRFGLVGIFGVAVNYATLYLLVEMAGLYLLLSTVIATEVAILNNFVFNSLWTFRDTPSNTTRLMRAVRYNIFTIGGLLISVVVMATLVHGLGLQYLLANLFAIGSASLWNYTLNARWTWNSTTPLESSTRIQPIRAAHPSPDTGQGE